MLPFPNGRPVPNSHRGPHRKITDNHGHGGAPRIVDGFQPTPVHVIGPITPIIGAARQPVGSGFAPNAPKMTIPLTPESTRWPSPPNHRPV